MSYSQKIMIVDDELFNIDVLEQELMTLGYHIITASDGEEALEIFDASEKEFEVLITDFMMPGIDGLELVRRLRERQPDLQVILIAGVEPDGLPEGDPSFVFLPKPISMQRLGEAVRDALRRRRQDDGGRPQPDA